MNIINFIINNWLLLLMVLIVVVFIVVLIWLWLKGRKDIVISLAKRAVMVAEEHLKSDTGQAKKEEAIAYVYERLPAILKMFISKKMIGDFIEFAVHWLHDQMEEKSNLKKQLLGEVQ